MLTLIKSNDPHLQFKECQFLFERLTRHSKCKSTSATTILDISSSKLVARVSNMSASDARNVNKTDTDTSIGACSVSDGSTSGNVGKQLSGVSVSQTELSSRKLDATCSSIIGSVAGDDEQPKRSVSGDVKKRVSLVEPSERFRESLRRQRLEASDKRAQDESLRLQQRADSSRNQTQHHRHHHQHKHRHSHERASSGGIDQAATSTSPTVAGSSINPVTHVDVSTETHHQHICNKHYKYCHRHNRHHHHHHNHHNHHHHHHHHQQQQQQQQSPNLNAGEFMISSPIKSQDLKRGHLDSNSSESSSTTIVSSKTIVEQNLPKHSRGQTPEPISNANATNDENKELKQETQQEKSIDKNTIDKDNNNNNNSVSKEINPLCQKHSNQADCSNVFKHTHQSNINIQNRPQRTVAIQHGNFLRLLKKKLVPPSSDTESECKPSSESTKHCLHNLPSNIADCKHIEIINTPVVLTVGGKSRHSRRHHHNHQGRGYNHHHPTCPHYREKPVVHTNKCASQGLSSGVLTKPIVSTEITTKNKQHNNGTILQLRPAENVGNKSTVANQQEEQRMSFEDEEESTSVDANKHVTAMELSSPTSVKPSTLTDNNTSFNVTDFNGHVADAQVNVNSTTNSTTINTELRNDCNVRKNETVKRKSSATLALVDSQFKATDLDKVVAPFTDENIIAERRTSGLGGGAASSSPPSSSSNSARARDINYASGNTPSSHSAASNNEVIECAPMSSSSAGAASVDAMSHQASKSELSNINSVANSNQSTADRRCRLCWCWCCPCSSITSRQVIRDTKVKGDVSSQSTDKKCFNPSNLSLEEIRSWNESFDKLMKCEDGRRIFQDFLRCEYSEENILFWIACEELKKEKDMKTIIARTRDIYEDYISILSAKEVSLDSRVRDVINNNIKTPTSNIFDDAQLQIYTLMHRDSYPRFINSPMYRKLAQLPPTSTTSISRKSSD